MFDKKIDQAMHDQLVKIKLHANVATLMQTMKNKSERKFDVFKQGGEQRDSMAMNMFSTQSKIINKVQDMYLEAKERTDAAAMKRKTMLDQAQIDNMEIIEYWNMKEKMKGSFNQRFACEKWVQISEQERQNLIYLDMFKHFKWLVEY